MHFIALRRNITYDALPKDVKYDLRCEVSRVHMSEALVQLKSWKFQILGLHPQLAITYDNEWALDSILRSVVVARRRTFWKRCGDFFFIFKHAASWLNPGNTAPAGAPPETEMSFPQNSGNEAMHGVTWPLYNKRSFLLTSSISQNRSALPENETDMAQNERASISCSSPRAPSKFRHKVPSHR